MNNIKILIGLFVVVGILFSGCISEKVSTPMETEQYTSSPTSTPTENFQSDNLNKINNLENKINLMQSQIDNLQTRLDNVGLPTQSDKSLIPQIPFRLEVRFGEWQTPSVWTFKENGEVEIAYASDIDLASYKLFRNNNTIKIDSKKYEYYGLVLYDNVVTSIFKNGWIQWAQEYHITPPIYNSVTQKYELP